MIPFYIFFYRGENLYSISGTIFSRLANAGSGYCGVPVHHRVCSRLPFIFEKQLTTQSYLERDNVAMYINHVYTHYLHKRYSAVVARQAIQHLASYSITDKKQIQVGCNTVFFWSQMHDSAKPI